MVFKSLFHPWVGKIPWRRKWQPTLVSLPGKSHGQRNLVDCSPWGHKESGRTEWLTHTQLINNGGHIFFPIKNWYNHLFGTKSHLQAFLNTSFLWILSILLLIIILITYKYSIVTLILKQTQPIVFHSTFPSKYFLLFLLLIMFQGPARITCFSNQISPPL